MMLLQLHRRKKKRDKPRDQSSPRLVSPIKRVKTHADTILSCVATLRMPEHHRQRQRSICHERQSESIKVQQAITREKVFYSRIMEEGFHFFALLHPGVSWAVG
jgi:hypothetical protein